MSGVKGPKALAARRKQWKTPKARSGDERGYRKLFLDAVQQADRGCDFEFLTKPITARAPVRKTK